MPFVIPNVSELRRLGRDSAAARIPGADATVPNSLLRVLSDKNAGASGLNLRYLAWLARQLMPDKAEDEWLIRWANLLLGGPKSATFAAGSVTVTGIAGIVIPAASVMVSSLGVRYATTAQVTLGGTPVTIGVEALDAGARGNLLAGAPLSFAIAISGADGQGTVVSITGGVDDESEDDLRTRVLERLRQTPMGGDADDYVAWAKQVPGVTRVWTAPQEMGIGTVTVRFMMDELRANAGGFPNDGDIVAVKAHLELRRPVTAKDLFVVAPVPEPIHFTLSNLDSDDSGTLANIAASTRAMLRDRARPAYALNGVTQPAQTIYREWVSAAVSDASGVEHFALTMSDHPMPSPGHMAVLGNITRV